LKYLNVSSPPLFCADYFCSDEDENERKEEKEEEKVGLQANINA